MKTLLLCDSFKGTLSSRRANQIIEEELKRRYPDMDISSLPFSDGGEGMLDVFEKLYPDAGKREVTVKDVFLKEDSKTEYLIHDHTAIIESAKAIGIISVEDRKNPMLTSTYPLGQLIKDALDKGCREFILGLGGSCTDDGGAGMLSALGIRFFRQNKEFIPTGGTLNEIQEIRMNSFDIRLRDCHFTILSDVDNPLLGEHGATYVFARQKGATEEMLPILEKGKKHYSEMMETIQNIHVSEEKGSGAAGGLGFAFRSFFSSRFVSGAEEILRRYDFSSLLENAGLVITGEGKLDESTLHGKVISVIAGKCKEKKIRCIAVCGIIDLTWKEKFHDAGISEILPVNQDNPRSFEEIKKSAESDLRRCIRENISAFVKESQDNY